MGMNPHGLSLMQSHYDISICSGLRMHHLTSLFMQMNVGLLRVWRLHLEDLHSKIVS
jgi:hypothetical protein